MISAKKLFGYSLMVIGLLALGMGGASTNRCMDLVTGGRVVGTGRIILTILWSLGGSTLCILGIIRYEADENRIRCELKKGKAAKTDVAHMTKKEIIAWLHIEDQEFGKDTGVTDKTGAMVRSGDIIERHYNECYGVVKAVVHWSVECVAFVSTGMFAAGNGFSSLNGESLWESTVIGNIDETPELYADAVVLSKQTDVREGQ